MSKDKQKTEETFVKSDGVQQQAVQVTIALDAFPYFAANGYMSTSFNLAKRLTARQAKALRALTEMQPSQTAVIQLFLDAVADAIEQKCNVKF